MGWPGAGLRVSRDDGQPEHPGRVFPVLQAHNFRIDTTILEKAKAAPQTRTTDESFYKHAWYLHMEYVAPEVARPDDELFVVGASLGTRKKRGAMHKAVKEVIAELSPTLDFRTASWNAVSDPCLQVADYCSWAVRRKWEMADTRSYNLIGDKIASERNVWEAEETSYY